RRDTVWITGSMSLLVLERTLPDVRDLILDAALKVFGVHGYADSSLDEILRAAGMTERKFQALFTGKADLAVAVLERESFRKMKNLKPRLATTKEEFWAEVRAEAVTQPTKAHSDSADLARLAISAKRSPEVAVRLKAGARLWHERMAIILRRGQELHAV